MHHYSSPAADRQFAAHSLQGATNKTERAASAKFHQTDQTGHRKINSDTHTQRVGLELRRMMIFSVFLRSFLILVIIGGRQESLNSSF